MTSYTIRRARSAPELRGLWSGRSWGEVPILEIAHFHPSGSEHRPPAQARLQYDRRCLYVHFRVQDRWVRAVSRRFQDPVWADSCVELFVRPRQDRGYFNFEMNCGGVLLLYYIEDPTRTPDGFVKYRQVEKRHLRGMSIFHSLPRRVPRELPGPVEWAVEYRIPFDLFAPYLGSPPQTAGAAWRGNLFKCADASSHPHWGSWAPIGEELNFHQPERFGVLSFEA